MTSCHQAPFDVVQCLLRRFLQADLELLLKHRLGAYRVLGVFSVVVVVDTFDDVGEIAVLGLVTELSLKQD
ncbi:hypothetical protein D3C78_1823080 [compost metagenome]